MGNVLSAGMSDDEWKLIESAPKDGTWILLEGEMRGGDTSCVMLGRWEPIIVSLGSYEWRCLARDACTGISDYLASPEAVWEWYAEGRIHHWRPLPSLPANQPS